MKIQARLLDVTEVRAGSELSVDASSGDTTLYIYDASDFSESGGMLEIEGAQYQYTTKDDDEDTLTLAAALTTAYPADTEVYLYPKSVEKRAMIETDEWEEPEFARVNQTMVPLMEATVRDGVDSDSVVVEYDAQFDEYVVVDVLGAEANLQGEYLDPATIPPPADVPVTISPVPSVLSGIRVLHVVWDPITGTNVQVEVHISTVSGFTPVKGDPTTLVATVEGTGTTIDKMPDGTPLEVEYDHDNDEATDPIPRIYYVKTIAYNDVSTAPPSAEASGGLRKINTPDISVDAAWVGTMTADRLRTGDLDVTMNLTGRGKIVATGAAGEEVSMSGADGFLVKGPSSLGNPTYVSFPTDGRPNIIGGVLNATTLTVEGDAVSGQAATFRRNSQMEPGATFTLNDSIVPPVGQPVAESITDEMKPNVTIGGTIGGACYSPSDDSIYIATYLWSNTTGQYTNRVYKISLATNTLSFVTTFIYGSRSDLRVRGLVKIGTNFYGLFYDQGDLLIGRFNPTITPGSWVNDKVLLGPNTTNQWGVCTLGTDGTDLWVAYCDTSNRPVFKRYLGDMSSNVSAETITTTYAIPASARGGMDLFSLVVGPMDYGARKFLLTFRSTQDVGSADTKETFDVAAFATSGGARETNSEFPLMASGYSYFLGWKGSSPADTAGQFVGLASYGYTPRWHRYAKTKLTGRTANWYMGSTFFRTSDSAETALSPQATFVMNSRWRWKATISTPPAGLVARIYIGTASGSANAKRQITLASGVISTTQTTFDAAGAGVGVGSTSFGSTTPSYIASQAMVVKSVPGVTCNATFTTITSAGQFRSWMVGKKVSGGGIDVGTTIASVASDSSAQLSKPAVSSVSGFNMSISVPKLEIRGDGYARITELERVILSSTQDADATANNEPALRIGDIAGTHMRIDGNEILAMTGNTGQGILYLNINGDVQLSGGTGRTKIGAGAGIPWMSQFDFGRKTSGTTDANSRIDFAHNLGVLPSTVQVTPSSNHQLRVFALGTSTVTVEVYTRAGVAVGSGATPNFFWVAIA